MRLRRAAGGVKEMDAREPQQVSPNTELLVLAGLSTLVILLPAFAPLEWLFPTLLGPLPIAILWIKYTWRHVLWLIGLQAGILLIIGALPSILLLVQYSIVGLTLGTAMQLGYTASRTISWSVALPIGIGSAVLLVVSAMAQQTPHAYLIAMFEELADALYEQLLEMDGLRDEEAMAAVLEALPRTHVCRVAGRLRPESPVPQRAELPVGAALPAAPETAHLLCACGRRPMARHGLPGVGISGQRRRPLFAVSGAQLHRPECITRDPGDLLHTGPGHRRVLGAPRAVAFRRVLAAGSRGFPAGSPRSACWPVSPRACSICGWISGANAASFRSPDPRRQRHAGARHLL